MEEKKLNFLSRIENLRKDNKSPNCILFQSNELQEKIDLVKQVQAKSSKSPNEIRLLKRYAVLNVNGSDKLIKTLDDAGSSILYYVSVDQMFDICFEAHLNTGHGRRDRMETELSRRYANVTRPVTQAFLDLCEECQLKRKKTKRNVVVKPIISNSFNSRGQVDLIDFQSQPDSDYKFILNYQDHLTKFIQLRALKTKSAAEVASALVEIFCIFGAPHILQSDNGREFDNKVPFQMQ